MAKSELQKAADRVRAIKQAIDNSKANLAVCHQEIETAKLAYEEAARNLGDAQGLLYAQEQKLEREREAVMTVLYAS